MTVTDEEWNGLLDRIVQLVEIVEKNVGLIGSQAVKHNMNLADINALKDRVVELESNAHEHEGMAGWKGIPWT